MANRRSPGCDTPFVDCNISDGVDGGILSWEVRNATLAFYQIYFLEATILVQPVRVDIDLVDGESIGTADVKTWATYALEQGYGTGAIRVVVRAYRCSCEATCAETYFCTADYDMSPIYLSQNCLRVPINEDCQLVSSTSEIPTVPAQQTHITISGLAGLLSGFNGTYVLACPYPFFEAYITYAYPGSFYGVSAGIRLETSRITMTQVIGINSLFNPLRFTRTINIQTKVLRFILSGCFGPRSEDLEFCQNTSIGLPGYLDPESGVRSSGTSVITGITDTPQPASRTNNGRVWLLPEPNFNEASVDIELV